MRQAVAALAVFSAVAIGCADDAAPPAPSAPPVSPEATAPPVVASAPFVFGPCEDEYRGARTCGIAKVPLDYARPDGRTVDLFVARYGSDDPSATQIYALPGGPGGRASDMLRYLSELAARPRTEVIAIEHRGVGRSSGLECPDAESAGGPEASRACLAEVERTWSRAELAHFTTTNAARDVAFAIAALRKDQPAFVYGSSYGTLWAHRFLQVADVPVDGVVLDSTLDPATPGLIQLHEFADRVLRRVGAACAANAECAARLGVEPYARMVSILGAADGAPCSEAPLSLGRAALADLVGAMLQQPFVNELVPSLLYRHERCAAGDRDVIARTMETLFGSLEPPGASSRAAPPGAISRALYANVVRAELWPDPAPTRASLEGFIFTSPLPVSGALATLDEVGPWPRYPRDEHYGKVADTEVPVLVLSGDFDVQTPVEGARALAAALDGPSARYIELPWVNHGVLSAITDGGEWCGVSIVSEFFANPKAAPAATCRSSLRAYSPVGYAGLVQYYYGTASPWDGAPGQQAIASYSSDPLAKARANRLRW